MKFTSQEEYGLRCLLQLARVPEGLGTIDEIAGREGLTHAYVAKLMAVLRRGGLVYGTRGQKGGYRLARPAAAIDVGTVLAVLGGRIYSSDFCQRHAGQERVCVHNGDCAIRHLWVSLDDVVQRALSRTTLQDLLGGERAMSARIPLGSGPAVAATRTQSS